MGIAGSKTGLINKEVLKPEDGLPVCYTIISEVYGDILDPDHQVDITKYLSGANNKLVNDSLNRSLVLGEVHLDSTRYPLLSSKKAVMDYVRSKRIAYYCVLQLKGTPEEVMHAMKDNRFHECILAHYHHNEFSRMMVSSAAPGIG